MSKVDLGSNGVSSTQLHVDDSGVVAMDIVPPQVLNKIMDQNAAERGNFNPKANMRKAASIDVATRDNWHKEWEKMREFGYTKSFPDFVVARCQSREYRHFMVNK